MVSDMCKYGKPKEANTEVGERNHKVFAKCIGRRCRKQHKTFANQVAVRLSDTFVIEKLASSMQLLMDDDDIDDASIQSVAHTLNEQESTKGATHYTLCLNSNKVDVSWQSSTEKHLLTFDTDLSAFIISHYMSTENESTINGCTELMQNQLLLRCHPSYQGEGPWFDWVSVHFEACLLNGKLFPEDNYPCKVMAIVPKGRNSFLEETGIVVQSAQVRTGKDSVLFEEWELMDGYHVVALSSVVESLFVLELGSKRIAVALPYSEWPSCFTDTSY
jgi:hypothetical protein